MYKRQVRIYPGQSELRVSLCDSERCAHRDLGENDAHIHGAAENRPGSFPGARHLHSDVLAVSYTHLRLLQRLAEEIGELATVESMPRQDGRNMTMVLAPTKRKADALTEQRKRREAERAERRGKRAERASKDQARVAADKADEQD